MKQKSIFQENKEVIKKSKLLKIYHRFSLLSIIFLALITILLLFHRFSAGDLRKTIMFASILLLALIIDFFVLKYVLPLDGLIRFLIKNLMGTDSLEKIATDKKQIKLNIIFLIISLPVYYLIMFFYKAQFVALLGKTFFILVFIILSGLYALIHLVFLILRYLEIKNI